MRYKNGFMVFVFCFWAFWFLSWLLLSCFPVMILLMWLQNFPKQVILLLLKSMKEQPSMELLLVEQLVLFLLGLFPPEIDLVTLLFLMLVFCLLVLQPSFRQFELSLQSQVIQLVIGIPCSKLGELVWNVL